MKKQIPIEAAIIIGFIILAAAAWALLIRPIGAEASDLRAEITDLEAALVAQQAARQLAGLEGRPKLKYAYGFDLTRALPDEHDVPRILLELDAITAEAGVSFDAIQPGDATTDGATGVLPLSATFAGSYSDLQAAIASLRRVTKVRNKTVRSKGRLYTIDGFDFHESEDGFPDVEATVEISTYALSAPEPVAATPEAAADGDDADGDTADDSGDSEQTDDSANLEGP